MKVEDNKVKTKIVDVPCGDCFEHSGETFLKTYPVDVMVIGHEVLKSVVAVNIRNGTYLCLLDDTPEENAQCVILEAVLEVK